MKYLLTIILFAASNFVFSQEQLNTVEEYQAPIYPGCENIKVSKERLICFQQNVVNNYTPYLNQYMAYFEYFNIADARATISFKLDNQGQIELKNIESNSSFFKVYNVLSFGDFMVNENKNKKIFPAKSIDGIQNLSMNLSFPIDFKINRKLNETKDRVIAILHDHEVSYELRLTPSKDIKIYEINEQRSFYLGKYNTLEEIVSILPYQQLINTTSEWTDLGTFSDEQGAYSIVVKNVFNRSQFSNNFVVYKRKGKKYKMLDKYNSLEKFMNSRYYDFLLRD